MPASSSPSEVRGSVLETGMGLVSHCTVSVFKNWRYQLVHITHSFSIEAEIFYKGKTWHGFHFFSFLNFTTVSIWPRILKCLLVLNILRTIVLKFINLVYQMYPTVNEAYIYGTDFYLYQKNVNWRLNL